MRRRVTEPRDVYLQIAGCLFAAVGALSVPFSLGVETFFEPAQNAGEILINAFLFVIFFSSPFNLMISSVGMFFLKKWGYVYGFITSTILCATLLYFGLTLWFQDVIYSGYCLLGAYFFFDICRHISKKLRGLS